MRSSHAIGRPLRHARAGRGGERRYICQHRAVPVGCCAIRCSLCCAVLCEGQLLPWEGAGRAAVGSEVLAGAKHLKWRLGRAPVPLVQAGPAAAGTGASAAVRQRLSAAWRASAELEGPQWRLEGATLMRLPLKGPNSTCREGGWACRTPITHWVPRVADQVPSSAHLLHCHLVGPGRHTAADTAYACNK